MVELPARFELPARLVVLPTSGSSMLVQILLTKAVVPGLSDEPGEGRSAEDMRRYREKKRKKGSRASARGGKSLCFVGVVGRRMSIC